MRRVLIDDPVVAALVTQLTRAATLGHSGRSFIEHLACTWRILADWKMPVAVCRAGFLHSAYSTSFYPHALFTLAERGVVRRAIGREGEGLVFRFCTMDRRGFWDRLRNARVTRDFSYPDRLRDGAPVRTTRKTLERLLIIESANIAEQSSARDGAPAPWMSRVLGWWEFLEERRLPVYPGARPRLSAESDRDAIATYDRALRAPPRQALPMLESAVALNPWAGELRILGALCAREVLGDGDFEQARYGAELLSRWAVAWDKRLSVAAWRALAARVECASRDRRVRHPDFATLTAILAREIPRPRWLDL